jgi:hypothetical protein
MLSAVGFVLLISSAWLHEILGERHGMIESVIAEGLTIAAWVSLWEALAMFLLDWFPHRSSIALFRRLAAADLTFAQHPRDGGEIAPSSPPVEHCVAGQDEAVRPGPLGKIMG